MALRRYFPFHPRELIDELRIRFNWPSSGRVDRAAFFNLWSIGGQALHELPEVTPRLELLVVITTCNRPGSCARLLEGLGEALSVAGYTARTAVLVFQDACSDDYAAARAIAASGARASFWLEARRRLAKEGFWRTYQTALLAAERWQPERTLFLHDDLELDSDLFSRVDALWRATGQDPDRRVLYLLSSRGDEKDGRWVHFTRCDRPEWQCRQTNWFDLQAFMVDRRFMELMRYRIVPVHPNRWRRAPSVSSGVGRQFSLRLFGRGAVYQAWPPLVGHGGEQSIANREARHENALDNREEYARARAARQY